MECEPHKHDRPDDAMAARTDKDACRPPMVVSDGRGTRASVGDLQAERSRLLDAAPAAAAKHGWTDAMVDVLCRHVDVGHNTFYECFGSVDDLYADLYDAKVADWLVHLRQALEEWAGGREEVGTEQLMSTLGEVAEYAAADRIWSIASMDYILRAARYEGVSDRYKSARRAYRAALSIEVSKALGLLALPIAEHDARRLVELLMVFHRGAVAEALLDDGSLRNLDESAWTAIVEGTTG